MTDHPPVVPTHHEAALLQRLRELAHQRDPVPEHVTAAARSALLARRGAGRGPDDTQKERGRGARAGTARNADRFRTGP